VNYVTFVARVLDAAVLTTGDDYRARLSGLTDPMVWQALDLGIDPSGPTFWGSEAHRAYLAAAEDLSDLYLIEKDAHRIKVLDFGFQVHAAGLSALWPEIFSVTLTDEELAFLGAVVELSEQPAEHFALLAHPTVEEVFTHLGWPWGHDQIERVVYLRQRLAGANLLRGVLGGGGHIFSLAPTYRGFVRIREAAPSVTRAMIEQFLPDWETTTVEFKRELVLERPREKAELAKDICALATTKASGAERYLVLGFDAKSHMFTKSVDDGLTQDRIEQILNAHTEGAPAVKLVTTPFANGLAGLILVTRDAASVPYRLKRTTADAHFVGRDTFVRHGSQVEAPSDAELDALIAEAERARGRHALAES
jgi:hypothetical protein